MLDLENLPCPVCGHIGSRIIHETSYPEQGYPGPFIMRRCQTCALLFNSPRLDDDGLAGLYGRNYYFFKRSDGRELARITGMHQRTIALIERQVRQRRCIDIGCGRGYFPAMLKRLGWDAAGIEISAEAAAYARQRFSLEVFTGTVEQYAQAAEARRFPLVTAIDVIEHVPRPREFIAAAAAIVEPGGYLIIDTPNAAAKNILLQGVSWKGFNPFHIYLFTIENLAAMLGRHGMIVQSAFSYGNRAERVHFRDRIAGGLKRIGLLGPAARAYFAIKGFSLGEGDVTALLDAAAQRIVSSPAYPGTPDAAAELASVKAGDNIIVIAKKGDDVLPAASSLSGAPS